jgi:hypothetical protein
MSKEQKPETPLFDIEWERLLHKLDFIQNKTDISKFLRPRKLELSEIKPLMVIRSPRDLPEVQKCFDNLKQVDKLWIKYYNDTEAHKIAREWVALHPEYTHIHRLDRPIYHPSVIGGHCLMQNIVLLNQSTRSSLFKWVELSNELRKAEMENPEFAKEVARCKKKWDAMREWSIKVLGKEGKI